MVKAGVTVKVVSERLGRANISITPGISAHIWPVLSDQPVAAFPCILELGPAVVS